MDSLTTYSVSVDIIAGSVTPIKLQAEIRDSSSVTNFSGLPVVGDTVYVQGGSIADQTSLNAVVANHVSSSKGQKNFSVKKYDVNNKLEKETWYNTDNGDGTYSGKVEETTYTYNGLKLISKTVKIFWLNGETISSEIYKYYQNNQNEIIEKKI